MEPFKISKDSILNLNLEETRSFYQSLFLQDSNILEFSKDWYTLRRRFEMEWEKQIIELWKKSVYKAYSIFFTKYPQYKNIDARYKILYIPSDKLIISKYRYILGMDPYFYGWNIVGKTLECILYGDKNKFSKEYICILYYCIEYLIIEIDEGKNTDCYGGLSPTEIIKKMEKWDYVSNEILSFQSKIDDIYLKYKNNKVKYRELYDYEWQYPKNIVFFLQKLYLPFINFAIHYRISMNLVRIVFNECKFQYKKEIPSNFYNETKWRDKIVHLYRNNKLKLSKSTRQEFEKEKKSVYSDKKILEMIQYMPNSSWESYNHHVYDTKKYKILHISENSEPISPLYISQLEYDKYNFSSVLHLIYFIIFRTLGMKSETAYGIIFSKEKGFFNISKYNIENYIDKYLKYQAKFKLFKILERKSQDENFQRQLILYKKFIFTSPGDYDLFIREFYQEALLHYRDRFIKNNHVLCKKWIYLSQFTTSQSIFDHLEKFYIRLHYTLDICNSQLFFNFTLASIKNIIKIMFPSYYLLYKKYQIEISNTSFVKNIADFMTSIKDKSSLLFLSNLLSASVYYYNEQKILIKKSDHKDVIRKICLLYTYALKNNNKLTIDEIVSAISLLLYGKTFPLVVNPPDYERHIYFSHFQTFHINTLHLPYLFSIFLHSI